MTTLDEKQKKMGELLKAEIALTNLAGVLNFKIRDSIYFPEAGLSEDQIERIEMLDINSLEAQTIILKILHDKRMTNIKEIVSLSAAMLTESLQNKLTETMTAYGLPNDMSVNTFDEAIDCQPLDYISNKIYCREYKGFIYNLLIDDTKPYKIVHIAPEGSLNIVNKCKNEHMKVYVQMSDEDVEE